MSKLIINKKRKSTLTIQTGVTSYMGNRDYWKDRGGGVVGEGEGIWRRTTPFWWRA